MKLENEYHIQVIKPELLEQYGFTKDCKGWLYRTRTKKEIRVWDSKQRHRKPYRMTSYTGQSMPFTMELAYLLVNMLKDGIIEFDVKTPQEKIRIKINKLKAEIKELEEQQNGKRNWIIFSQSN